MPTIPQYLKEKLLTAITQIEYNFSMAKVKDKLNVLEPIKIIPYYTMALAIIIMYTSKAGYWKIKR